MPDLRHPKDRLDTRLSLAALLGLALFLVILLIVPQGPLTADRWVLDFMVAHREMALSAAIKSFSALGAFRVLAPITLVVFLWSLFLDRRLAGFFLLTMVSSALLNELLKYWVGRPRPGEPWAVMDWTSYAFPSGHSMASASFALAFCIVWNKLYRSRVSPQISIGVQLLLGLYVIAIGFTRVYLGAHYPSDVVAGWGMAVAWVVAMYALYNGITSAPQKAKP